MRRKLTIVLLLIALAVVLVGVFYAPQRQASQKIALKAEPMILFYGIGCPHCINVERFLQKKSQLTVPLVRKEVYSNRANLRDLIDKAKKCNAIKNGGIPIPLLWRGHNQCITGDTPVMRYLNKFIKK